MFCVVLDFLLMVSLSACGLGGTCVVGAATDEFSYFSSFWFSFRVAYVGVLQRLTLCH